MRRAWTRGSLGLALCGLVACAAMQKPDSMVTYEEETAAKPGELVAERYPELAKNAAGHHAVAVEARDDKEESLLAHHANLTFLWWRAATTRSHADDLVAQTKELDEQLAQAEEDLRAAQKQEKLARSAIERTKQVLALQGEVADSADNNAAREAINQALAALKDAERVDASTYASAKFTEAENKLKAATAALGKSNSAKAKALAGEAEIAAASAKAEAEPKYASNKADSQRNAAQRALFEGLDAISGAKAAIVQGGVQVTIIQSFEAAGVDIRPETEVTYSQVADIAKAHPTLSLVIEGHTDTKGNRTKNLQLSEARAKSVMSFLSTKGVEPGRINALGKGSEEPVASNKTKEGRAQNRRIEILFATPGV